MTSPSTDETRNASPKAPRFDEDQKRGAIVIGVVLVAVIAMIVVSIGHNGNSSDGSDGVDISSYEASDTPAAPSEPSPEYANSTKDIVWSWYNRPNDTTTCVGPDCNIVHVAAITGCLSLRIYADLFDVDGTRIGQVDGDTGALHTGDDTYLWLPSLSREPADTVITKIDCK